MESINKATSLTIIIPTLNEAERLPLLLADLQSWGGSLQIVVVDCGSSDQTRFIAELAGAQVIQAPKPNRGEQLALGASHSLNDWLLFLHADSRLSCKWEKIVKSKTNDSEKVSRAWYFDFRVKEKGILFRIMEFLVFLRSDYLHLPYGDQGLLIEKSIYKEIGGFTKIKIMEDIDIINKLTKRIPINSLGIPIYTDARKWRKNGILMQCWKNLRLRRRWNNGESPSSLFRRYYQ